MNIVFPPCQAALDEGDRLQASLREALSHQPFLKDSLMPVMFEKLLSEGSDTLRKADAQKAALNQSLTVFKPGFIFYVILLHVIFQKRLS